MKVNAKRFNTQVLWPAAWRINRSHSGRVEPILVAELVSAWSSSVADVTPSPQELQPGCHLSESGICELCTQLFRMERNAHQLAEKDACRQTRGLDRSHRRIRKALSELEVEFKDLSGEIWHPGRKDIEVLAAAESADVEKPTIDGCESPVVLIRGQIIQQAKGTVISPVQAQA